MLFLDISVFLNEVRAPIFLHCSRRSDRAGKDIHEELEARKAWFRGTRNTKWNGVSLGPAEWNVPSSDASAFIVYGYRCCNVKFRLSTGIQHVRRILSNASVVQGEASSASVISFPHRPSGVANLSNYGKRSVDVSPGIRVWDYDDPHARWLESALIQ